MKEDKEELLAEIKTRMKQEGNGPEAFYLVMKKDPYLLKDLFYTFSDQMIVDATLDPDCQNTSVIGVWVTKKGQNQPFYAEICTMDRAQMKTKKQEVSFA